MSDVPFGFSQHNPDDKDGKPGGNPFDFSQLGNMLSQLGAMLSSAGSSSGPVNYDLAKQIAFQQLSTTTTTIGFAADQSGAVTDAVHLAEMWLDPVTSLPAGTARTARATGTLGRVQVVRIEAERQVRHGVHVTRRWSPYAVRP